jgi:hypothetical protein
MLLIEMIAMRYISGVLPRLLHYETVSFPDKILRFTVQTK